MRVRGRLKHALWIHEESSPRKDKLKIPNIGWADIKPDALEDEFMNIAVDTMPVHLLEMSAFDSHHTGSQGLVLRDLGNGRFSRLGIYSFRELVRNLQSMSDVIKVSKKLLEDLIHWFDGCDPQIITIV